MTMRIEDMNETDLQMWEALADKQGWDEIKHMVRDERQVRMI